MSDPREGARLALEAVRDEMRNDNGDAPLTGFELYQLLGRAVCGERLNPAACSFEDTERHDECEGLDDAALARLSTTEAENEGCAGWRCSFKAKPCGCILDDAEHQYAHWDDHTCANCHRPYSECMASRTQPEPAKGAEPVMPRCEFVCGEPVCFQDGTGHDTHSFYHRCAREGCGKPATDPCHGRRSRERGEHRGKRRTREAK
jgi:hypothetical protein